LRSVQQGMRETASQLHIFEKLADSSYSRMAQLPECAPVTVAQNQAAKAITESSHRWMAPRELDERNFGWNV
jgi:hypothetical protein